MIRRLCLLLAVLALAGCSLFTRHITVSTDGYAAATTPAPGRYILVSGTPRVVESDLQFQSYAGALERALASRGWTRVKDRGEATTLIRFRYGVSDPVPSVREYETPEFGVTGHHFERVRTVDTVNGQPVVTEHATITPAYGQTGTTRRTDARLLYAMSVVVEAYDLTARTDDGNPPQAWKTVVGATDGSGDLRGLLPILLNTAAPHFGRDTQGVVRDEVPAE